MGGVGIAIKSLRVEVREDELLRLSVGFRGVYSRSFVKEYFASIGLGNIYRDSLKDT
jgi:hypothetical protein